MTTVRTELSISNCDHLFWNVIKSFLFWSVTFYLILLLSLFIYLLLSAHKPALCCSSWPSLAQTGSHWFYPGWSGDMLLCRLKDISAVMHSVRLLKNGSVMCFPLYWGFDNHINWAILFRKRANVVKWNSLHCLVIWMSSLIRPIKKDKIESWWRLDFPRPLRISQLQEFFKTLTCQQRMMQRKKSVGVGIYCLNKSIRSV